MKTNKNWEKELKEIYKGLISEGLAVEEYEKVKKLIRKTRQDAVLEVLGEVRLEEKHRSAYVNTPIFWEEKGYNKAVSDLQAKLTQLKKQYENKNTKTI